MLSLVGGNGGQVRIERQFPVLFQERAPDHSVIEGGLVTGAVSGSGGEAVIGVGHQRHAALHGRKLSPLFVGHGRGVA